MEVGELLFSQEVQTMRKWGLFLWRHICKFGFSYETV